MLHSLQSARLLLVDDEVSHLCLLQNILNRIGYRHVETLSDSRQIFLRIAEFQPDLLITDLNMPHLDGFTIVQQLGKIVPAEDHLPVLVLTSELTAPSIRRALAVGASDVLTKPFDTSEAIMRIRNLLEMRAMRRQLQEHNHVLEIKVAERTQELRETQRQIVAQERLRAFGEMAGGVVHDFNNALMSVIGYSEILLGDEAMLGDREMVRQFLTVMNTAGRDASHVIGRLRDFYRPREESDVFVPVDLNKVLEEVVPLTQPKWRDQALAAGRVIEVELDLAQIPLVLGNAAELREIATNLIFNAVDAMPDGGRITLRTRPDGKKVIWEVCDTGTGMTEEVRARCLEPFFSTKGDKGTGLGLSMVFGIIKRHEGQLEIDSYQGAGTTMRFQLPGLVDALEPCDVAPVTAQQPLDVLVVDDEPVTRFVLAKYLRADGHTVTTATNPAEAFEHLEGRNFDLILTDHSMPQMTGLQFAETLRQRRADQRVIMVTGCADDSLQLDERPGGIDLIIRKPVPRSDLRRAVATVMQRYAAAESTPDNSAGKKLPFAAFQGD